MYQFSHKTPGPGACQYNQVVKLLFLLLRRSPGGQNKLAEVDSID